MKAMMMVMAIQTGITIIQTKTIQIVIIELN